MRLFHGSNLLIDQIDLDKSKSHKDFGNGFYLTQDYSRAVRMANRTVAIQGIGSPEITPFIFNLQKARNSLSVKIFKERTAEWALFVMNNRDRNISFSHRYDIVIGPVADSRVDPIINDYKEMFGDDYDKPENLKKLAKLLKYPGPEYIQYCFCTENSIKQLILDL